MVLHCLTSIAAHSKSKWECSRGNHKNLSLEDFICKGFRVIMEDRMNNKMYPISKIVLLFYYLQLLCCYYCLVMFLNSSIRNNWPNFLLVLGRYGIRTVWPLVYYYFSLPVLSEPWCQLFKNRLIEQEKHSQISLSN